MVQLKLLGYFAAITVCFILYSLLQERLITLPFEGGERFKYSLFVILVNRIVTVAVAAAALALTEHSIRPAAPVWQFAVPSVANVVSSAAQYEALKYVSFPLQALAKCAKTVPVMAWGFCIGGTRYRRRDYLCSALVTAGCAIFVLTGDIAAPSISAAAGALAGDQQHWALVGGGLLAAFLLFDGLASTSQDRLFSSYTMHSCNQLLWVTAWSAAVSFSTLTLSGQLAPAVGFVVRHPGAMGLILAMSGLSTAAQLFIFTTIQQYGALRFALVMTLRQFLSIVLSCVVFSHHLSLAQWAGTALVIGALIHRGRGRGGPGRGLASKLTPNSPGPASLERAEEDRSLLIPVISEGQAFSPSTYSSAYSPSAFSSSSFSPSALSPAAGAPAATKRSIPSEGPISLGADGSTWGASGSREPGGPGLGGSVLVLRGELQA